MRSFTRAGALAAVVATLVLVVTGMLVPGSATAADAAAKAGGKLTVKETNSGNLKGRLTSAKAACERQRPLMVFYREPGSSDPYQAFGIAQTNGRGRWQAEGPGTRYRLFMYAPFTSSCAGVQSDSITTRPGEMMRAAKAAKVRATLRFGETSVRGTVKSSKASCVRNRPVYAIGWSDGEPVYGQYLDDTNRRGKYRYDFGASTAGASPNQVSAFVLAKRGCGVGESPRQPLPIS